MKTIHKYSLATGPQVSSVSMPESAEIISCDLQHGLICLWVKVDQYNTYTNVSNRKVLIVGTGGGIHPSGPDKKWEFIKTVIDGQFVWHIFVEGSNENLKELARSGT